MASSKPLVKSVTLRKLGRFFTAYKVEAFRWMGSVAVRVTSPQRKPEVKGGNLPGLPARRRRTRRGKRSFGKMRGRQPRSHLNAPDVSQNVAREPNRVIGRSNVPPLSKVKRRRMRWIEGRFRILENAKKSTEKVRIQTRCKDGTSGVLEVPLFVRKYRELRRDLRKKRFPCPPGMSTEGITNFRKRGEVVAANTSFLGAWFRRYMELKYGTWEEIHGELTVGFFPFDEKTRVPNPIPTQRYRDSRGKLRRVPEPRGVIYHTPSRRGESSRNGRFVSKEPTRCECPDGGVPTIRWLCVNCSGTIPKRRLLPGERLLGSRAPNRPT